MKITLMHVTDPHWICKDFVHTNLIAKDEMASFAAVKEAFATFQKQHLRKHLGDKNCLIHTGDSANHYYYHNSVPHEVQFREISRRLLPLLENIDGTIEYDLKIAVPGNHDVHRRLFKGTIEFTGGSKVIFNPPLEKIPAYDDCHLVTTSRGEVARQYKVQNLDKNSIELESIQDLKIGDEFEVFPNDRFRDFKHAFHNRGWETSESKNVLSLDSWGPRPLLFWLINSSELCGINRNGKDEVIDTVSVTEADLSNWTNRIGQRGDDLMRIALLHHNPLPNYIATDSQEKTDVFTNSGPFLETLVKTDIKLVLSGHQHVGDEVYVARPDRLNKNFTEFASPYIESGFLSVAGPTLSRLVVDGAPGFNVFEITFLDNIAEIKLTRYRCLNRKFNHSVVKYRVATIPISRIHSSPLSQQRRFDALASTVQLVYSRKPLEPIERILKTQDPKEPVSILIKKENACRLHSKDNLFGVYALNVLPPTTWYGNDLTRHFLGSFLDYYSKAQARSQGSDSLEFNSSYSVMQAITISLENAQALNIYSTMEASHRSNLTSDQQQWLDGALGRGDDNICSLSKCNALRQNVRIRAESGLDLKWTGGDWDIPLKFGDISNRNVKGNFEIARIALWRWKDLKSEYALRLIEFHEKFCVPLFWLHPDRLLSLLQNDTRRKEIGTFSMCVYQDPDQCSKSHLISYKTNREGEFSGDSDYYQKPKSSYHAFHLSEQLWGIEGCPKSLVGISDEVYPLAEFKTLLHRPDIMMASDAYALMALKGEDVLGSYLTGLDAKCNDWLLAS